MLFKPSFLHAERSTKCTTELDTLDASSRDLLTRISGWPSESVKVLHTIHVLSLSSLCCSLARVARTSPVVLWVYTSRIFLVSYFFIFFSIFLFLSFYPLLFFSPLFFPLFLPTFLLPFFPLSLFFTSSILPSPRLPLPISEGKLPFAATPSHRSSIFVCTSGHTTELMDVARGHKTVHVLWGQR